MPRPAAACRAIDALPRANLPWSGIDDSAAASNILAIPRHLSPEALNRAFPAAGERWERGETFMLHLAAASEIRSPERKLKIAVIGGSMTAGADCAMKSQLKRSRDRTFGELQQQCAWPSRLEKWLVEVFGPVVSVQNLAKGAHSTGEWAAVSHHQDPNLLSADLIITELSVNDQHIVSENDARVHVQAASAVLFHDLLTLPQKPAVLALEVVRGAFTPSLRTNLVEVRKMCPQDHPLAPNASTRYGIGSNQMYRWCDHWWLPPTWRKPVLAALHVPVVSYRDATWPDRLSPPIELPLYYWNGHSHPNGSTHQLLANSVAYALYTTALRMCHASQSGESRHNRNAPNVLARDDAVRPHLMNHQNSSQYIHELRREFQRCDDPITSLFPPRENFEPISASSEWWYGEDVTGNNKPGWNACANASNDDRQIVFKVRFHSLRMGLILIKYLRSYDPTMGKVEALLRFTRKNSFRWEVNAYNEAPFSLAQFFGFRLPQYALHVPDAVLEIKIIDVPENVIRARLSTLDDSLRGKLSTSSGMSRCKQGRFKLLGVVTC